MAGKGMAFDQFLAAEVAKYKGIAVPRRAGLLERALRRLVKAEKIHPNPDDEFCMPEIGPNYEIITHYGEAIRDAQLKHGNATLFAQDADWKEKIIRRAEEIKRLDHPELLEENEKI